jgi:SAM-dependent methyltransferase
MNEEKLFKLIDYAVHNKVRNVKELFGGLYPAGYYHININNKLIKGQRDPKERLKNVPYDFKNKTVLDIGCNQGGMLFELQKEVQKGIGIEYHPILVNIANKIKNENKYDNLEFYNYDIEKEPFELVNNYIPNPPDIIFLLSVCMWVNNWKELIKNCSLLSKTILFESNGSDEQQEAQKQELDKYYKVDLINEKSLDDIRQHKRKLYIGYRK